MRKNTYFTAPLLAVCILFSQAAQAVAVDISSMPSEIVLGAGGSAQFGDKFKKNQYGAVFADRFTFTTFTVSSVDFIVTSISTSAANGLNLTGLGLYNLQGQVAAGVQTLTGIEDSWTLTAANLTAGSYYVKVSGDMVSLGGAAFGGNGRIAAVPEPENYAMVLGGLALVGFMARRRNGVAKVV